MPNGLASEVLYGVKATVNSFRNDYPDERVLFSSATTFSEFKDQSRRGIARRGVIIFTEKRLFFKSVLFSLYTFVYVVGAVISFWAFFRTQNLYYLIAGVIVGAMVTQRLPLQRSILLKDINSIELDSVAGNIFTGNKKRYRLKVATDDKLLFFWLATLPDEIKQKLGIIGENNALSERIG